MKLLSDSILKDLESSKNIDIQTYQEIGMQYKPMEDDFCFKCDSKKEPLTLLYPEYYHLPCWDCIGDRKTDRADQTNNIIRNIKDFYSMIHGDRYYHLFVSDDLYFKSTLPHKYDTFKKVLQKLTLPSRNDLWYISWEIGFPKIISEQNIEGIQVVNLTKRFEIIQEKDYVKVGDYFIYPPEVIPYDSKHHYRYSLFNLTTERKTKRLKIGEKCIKFYSGKYSDCKSIFQIRDIEGNPVPILDITKQELWVIKMSIMRNRGFLKLIFDTIIELLRLTKYFKDNIFLKNNILISPDKDKSINLDWVITNPESNFINLSVL